MITKFYKSPGLSSGQLNNKLQAIVQVCSDIDNIETELCYYIECSSELSSKELDIIKFTLSSSFTNEKFNISSVFQPINDDFVIEIGPRLNFSTPLSSNAVSIFRSAELNTVMRVEVATRYLIKTKKSINNEIERRIVDVLHDKMTECRYFKPIETFDHGFKPEEWFEVDILNKGKKALEDVNNKLGLAFDDWDLNFYTDLFRKKLKRNPTSVECFDLAQSNSEHSRHWFFRGKMIVDGEEKNETLFQMIIDTQRHSNQNNIIKFADNSSAIEGFNCNTLIPNKTHCPSSFKLENIHRHLIFTAETHNFPTGVAPFSGATTGTGGRLRDIQGCGRGGYYIAGTAGYSVGNLRIPGYDLPWEDQDSEYPKNLASPLEIIVEASNGASDYGNKFGEPVICGFSRSFGMKLHDQRREWIKPIMFSGGLGTVDANMAQKLIPEKGMEVVKIGGPVYRIGVGGGSASSVAVQGDNQTELDFGAVQRGDAEMEQKLNRFVRACTEMGINNPIISIHDQGAGGNGNVLKELVEPAGAVIFTKKFDLGDPSISTMELWGAEYQENDAILCKKNDTELLKSIAKRERCPINFVGTVTGNGKIILSEDVDCDATKYMNNSQNSQVRHPVDLDLELILGKMPQKTFNLTRKCQVFEPLSLPESLTIQDALARVLRLPSVGSKRYLTNKVDRCVTGLIAQQQCVGPLHTPLADVAVTAISHFSTVGIATSIGEQPIKGLIDVASGARMTVIEALSNLVFAKITDLKDVKCSGNWMWAAKLDGEGAALYDACQAMCSLMNQLGIAIDGGKDSLSMAARVDNEIVISPGTLVVSCYAPCSDIRLIVTPDLKAPSMNEEGCLLFIDLSLGKNRISGTALAQVFNQLGNDVPDVENVETFVNAFKAIQQLIQDKKILSGHDVSDGGLVTCLLEMAFAGLSGIDIKISHKSGNPIEILFAEEIGWILEIRQKDLNEVQKVFDNFNVPAFNIGKSRDHGIASKVIFSVGHDTVLNTNVLSLMEIWEETSYQLERRQTNVECANAEFNNLKLRKVPSYKLSFNPDVPIIIEQKSFTSKIPVAVIREEGSNGDREMAASLIKVGFEVWDIAMQDIFDNQVSLDQFRGIIFPGGFSYADVLGSAKGWATSLLFNLSIRKQLERFISREDTFSLGVCNGCQLMNHLGWIDGTFGDEPNIALIRNKSERFECRWTTVKIKKSSAIMLQGMENTIMGVWVAHGEGRFQFKNNKVLDKLRKQNCLAIQYTDESGNPTEVYPLNPNGSVEGIAGICSINGRHLAMMPHPERCTEMWQWPYIPCDWTINTSPWLRIFQNAFNWCVTN